MKGEPGTKHLATAFLRALLALAVALLVVGVGCVAQHGRGARAHPLGAVLTASACDGSSFCIYQQGAAPALVPGGQPAGLGLAVSNPLDVPLHVSSLTVSFTNSFPSGCDASDLEVGGQPASGSPPSVTLDPDLDVSPVTNGVNGSTGYDTTLALADAGSDQDSCEGLSLAMAYTAEATYTAPTSTVLSSGANPSVANESVTLTAVVSAGDTGQTPVGSVAFDECADAGCATLTDLGTQPVDGSGTAVLSIPLSAGQQLVAVFTPTDPTDFDPSTSAPLSQQVNAPVHAGGSTPTTTPPTTTPPTTTPPTTTPPTTTPTTTTPPTTTPPTTTPPTTTPPTTVPPTTIPSAPATSVPAGPPPTSSASGTESTTPSDQAPPTTSPPDTTPATTAPPTTDDSGDTATTLPGDDTTDTTAPPAPSSVTDTVVQAKFGFGAGAPVAGSEVTVTGQDMDPGTVATITVHSTPQVLKTITVGPSGSFSTQVFLPSGLEAGQHHLVVEGEDAKGQSVNRGWAFAVSTGGLVTGVGASAPALPIIGIYHAVSQPKVVVKTVVVTSVALLSAVGAAGGAGSMGGGMAGGGAGGSSGGGGTGGGAPGGGGGDDDSDGSREGEGRTGVTGRGEHRLAQEKRSHASIRSTSVKWHKLISGEHAPGDRSRTWRWPGTAAVDALSKRIPPLVGRVSPLMGRLTADAAYLRAAFGSAALTMAPLAAVLGVVAGFSTAGHVLPPATGLFLALTLVGIFDALAGLAAILAFGATCAALGGFDSADAVRTLLGLGVIWFLVPVLCQSMRPFRRAAPSNWGQRWDRGADYLLASLVGAWGVKRMIGALPALAGYTLPIEAQAAKVAFCVLGAVVVRMALEGVVVRWYPTRLAAVEPGSVPEQALRHNLAGSAVKLVVYLFVAAAYLGDCWQLWAGGALFLVCGLLDTFDYKCPNLPKVWKVMPPKPGRTVMMLVIGGIGGLVLDHLVHSPHQLIADGFFYLSLPSLVIAVIYALGRNAQTQTVAWKHRLAGVPVVTLGVLLALGVVVI